MRLRVSRLVSHRWAANWRIRDWVSGVKSRLASTSCSSGHQSRRAKRQSITANHRRCARRGKNNSRTISTSVGSAGIVAHTWNTAVAHCVDVSRAFANSGTVVERHHQWLRGRRSFVLYQNIGGRGGPLL